MNDTKSPKHDSSVALLLSCLIFIAAPFSFHSNAGGVGLELPINIGVWFFAVIFLWWGVRAVFQKGYVTLPENFIFLGQLLPVLVIASLFAGIEQPLLWFLRLGFIAGGLLFCFLLVQLELDEHQQNIIMFVVVLSGAIHSLVLILESLDSSFIQIIYSNLFGSRITASSSFQQINNFSTYEAMCFLISLHLITVGFCLNSRLLTLVLPIFSALTLYAILDAGSRVAVISSIFSGLFLLARLIWHLKKRAVLVLYVLALLTLAVNAGFQKNFESSDLPSADNTEFLDSQRREIYTISFELIENSPWRGYGIGSFPSAWQAAKAEYLDSEEHTAHIQALVSHPHNEFLFWQIESGFLATISVAIFCLGIAIIAGKVGLTYLLVLVPLFAHNMVELPFHTSAIHWILLMLILGFSLQKQSEKKIGLNRVLTFYKPLVYGIFFSVLLVFGHAWYVSYHLNNAAPNMIRAGLLNPITIRQTEKVMYKQLLLGSDSKDKGAYDAFVKWAEIELSYNPHPSLFADYISALRQLGLKSKSCEVLSTALRIYPAHKRLYGMQAGCVN